MALQHLRASTADKRPTPAAMADGQLAMNTNLASPGLFFKDSNGDLVKTGPVHVGTTAPNATPGAGGQAGNSKGELWLDTSGSDYSLKTWDGTAFREIVVTSTMIKDGTIVNADVNASAAIAGTKISPDFGSQTVATTGIFSHALGSAGAPTITFTGDTNTGIYSPSADTLAFVEGGVEAMRIDSSGNVGIGTSSPQSALDIGGIFQSVRTYLSSVTDTYHLYRGTPDGTGFEHARVFSGRDTSVHSYGSYLAFYTEGKESGTTDTSTERLRIDSSGRVGIGTTSPNAALDVRSAATWIGDGTTDAFLQFNQSATAANRWHIGAGSSNALIFYKGTYGTGSETARIDSSGRLLVGTSSTSASTNFLVTNGDAGKGVINIASTSATPADGQDLGYISFNDSAHTYNNAIIRAQRDGGTWTATTSKPTRLVFSTTADGASTPTERMRIEASGNVGIGAVGVAARLAATSTGTDYAGYFSYPGSTAQGIGVNSTGAGSSNAIFFFNNGATVGSISTTASTTAYNTSSDYRLKENVVSLTGAIDRINDLQVRRFNFIADPDRTVDGFIAHEAQAVVPECVTGEKDAVDGDGNPVYQGIDQSKLVPLLTAALQEAIAKIETLEARITALEP